MRAGEGTMKFLLVAVIILGLAVIVAIAGWP